MRPEAQLAVVECFNGGSTCWTRQIVFDGMVQGLVYGLLAMGVVLIYRSTRVFNFAVGNIGLPGTLLLALLVIDWGTPFWVAVAVSLAVGALIGAVVELTVIRRLFTAPRVIVLVATVGIAQLMQGVIAAMPEVDENTTPFPVIVGRVFEPISGLRIEGPQLMIVIIVPLVAIALGAILNRTTFGKAVAASASNPELSRLSAVNPKIVSTFVWTMAGLLSTLSMVLLNGGGNVTSVQNLGPLTLSRALAAAVIASFVSFPRAVLGGVAIGLVESLLRFNFLTEPGLIDFVLFAVVTTGVWIHSKRSQEDTVMSFGPKIRPISASLRSIPVVRIAPKAARLVLLAVIVLLPFAHTFRPSQLVLYSTIIGFAICALSVTVVTGWGGQLSLSQMSFAGLGALTAAALARGLTLQFGWGSQTLIDLEFPPIPMVAAIGVAGLGTAAFAVIIGLASLRVRGLELAVSTFAFAIAAQQYIYERPVFSDGQDSVQFRRGTLFGIDLADQRTYFYSMLVALVVVIWFLGRIRNSGVGRSTIAVRDNEQSAAACTIDPGRMKLQAFAVAGAIAGFGGALLGGLVRNIQYSESLFTVDDSITVVSMAVIGGLGSISGPVLGALWVEGLPAFWPDSTAIPLLTSSIGVLLVLMYFPGGFNQISYAMRDAFVAFVARRRRPIEPEPTQRRSLPTRRAEARFDGPALDARGITVRFGGITAVDDVDLRVEPDEIVGLIGNNGAGKSTLMNAIGGYVPADGTVHILGRDVSNASSAKRAAAGLGRTFQSARLFPELTVRESVQVALEAQGHTSFIRTGLGLGGGWERRRRADADDIIDYLGLGAYADTFTSELSTGTRRIVEIANLLALDAKVLCLDEPTAGLAQREAEAFAPLVLRIREELGASMLVIEHDMPMIMGISDRVVCLDAGAVIAGGDPERVRRDPKVVAAYLGTDERAIDRSDTQPTSPHDREMSNP